MFVSVGYKVVLRKRKMNNRHTFHGKFKGGISVTVIFDEDEFRKSREIPNALTAEWTGEPSKKTVPSYIVWMHTVMQSIAEIIDDKVCYSYPGNQVWIYFPDGTRKRIKESEVF